MNLLPIDWSTPYGVSTISQFKYRYWTIRAPSALRNSFSMYLTTAVFPVPVFPKMSTLLGRSPFSAVTRICASCPMWLSRCGRRSGRYDGRRISRSILNIVRVLRYGWKMLSSMWFPAPPESEKVRLARLLLEKIARERAGIRGTPQKGLRVFDAIIDGCGWPDFYSHPFMIGPFEPGLKLHAPSNT